jgi:hypothetical protein
MIATPAPCSCPTNGGGRPPGFQHSTRRSNMKQALELASIFALLSLFLLGPGCQRKEGQIKAHTKTELVQLISSIEPWRASGKYPRNAWDQAIRVARILQHSEPDIVGQALDDSVSSNLPAVRGDCEENSKPFLLLRLMFDLPQTNASGSEPVWLRTWRYSGSNPPAASWPIGWTNGQPFLLEAWQGSYGRPYAARAEYDQFRRSFPLRQLRSPEDGVK